MSVGEHRRRLIEIRGRVQGVGFRPFVHRLASELGLAGHVGNDPRGVFVEVEGPPRVLDAFERRVRDDAPALARVAELSAVEIEPKGIAGSDSAARFAIIMSDHRGEQRAEISPDVATCPDCLREMRDPADRRHGYPFTNCTNCGPRYSIVLSVPYDRPATTMSGFRMCAACRAEYDDPADRRFHAQPNACPECGPRVWLEGGGEGEAIARTAELLASGSIVAIKGIGGFHLACRADDDGAAGELRRRKGREARPFALMAASIDEAERLVELDRAAREAMVSWRRPIVIAPRRHGAPVSAEVAPGTHTLGVMLPYTPLHELLFDCLRERGGPLALVMTSANPSDEPLCADNDEARARLGGIADAFLMHDRPIARRVDDSVVMATPLGIVPVRRSRGWVPEPLDIPVESPEPVLAVGGEMKSAVCILSGLQAVASEHLGELSNAAAYRNFVAAIDKLRDILRVKPAVVAHDLHPDYPSTRWAKRSGLRTVAVQHHHAHAAACMAEHGLEGRAIAIVADGTGYGTDGAVWGAEVLVAGYADFSRAGHLDYFRLAGGDAAARDTWRPAVALFMAAFGEGWREESGALFAAVDPEALNIHEARLAAGAGVPSSSMGRLFDGAAFVIAGIARNRHEAEAPVALESMAARALRNGAAPEPLRLPFDPVSGLIDFRPAVREMAARAIAGRPPEEMAFAFHLGVADALAEAATFAARSAGLDRVALSGGCFLNAILLSRVIQCLRSNGLRVYLHSEMPPGDGCVSLGQAAVAAARLAKEVR